MLIVQGFIREIQLPPSVTSVHGQFAQHSSPDDWEALKFFPTSTERLNYEFKMADNSVPFLCVLERYHHLNYLRVGRIGTMVDTSHRGVPKCLEELDVRETENFPQSLLEHPSIKVSSLTSLSLNVPIFSERSDLLNMNLGLLLPSTLTSLALHSERPSYWACARRVNFSNLPKSLVELAVCLQTPVPNLFDSVGQLSHLKKLRILENHSSVNLVLIPIKKSLEVADQAAEEAEENGEATQLALGHLPSSLKTLYLALNSIRALKSDELSSLPTGLRELHTAAVCENHQNVLQQRSPSCRVFLTQ